MRRRRVLLLSTAAVVLVALAALSGCGMLIRKGTEAATGVKVDQNGGKVTIQGKDGGTATVQEGKLYYLFLKPGNAAPPPTTEPAPPTPPAK